MERLLASIDGTNDKLVYLRATEDGKLLTSQGSAAMVDRELLTTTYRVKTAFTGASVGDAIRRVDTLDVSTATSTVVSVVWTNLSTNADIAAPSLANIELVTQGDSLTQAQLMASGLATASNQVSQLGYLADLADGNDRFGNYKLINSEDLGAGTKYICKAVGSAWVVIRKTYTDTAATFSYATLTNNPTVTTPTAAWAARPTLTYGAPQA